MKATETLHDRGQSLWLDNITRDLLDYDLARLSTAPRTLASSLKVTR